MRSISIILILLFSSQSVYADRKFFSCRGETADETIRVHGSFDLEASYTKTFIVDWRPKPGSPGALPTKRWIFGGKEISFSNYAGGKFPTMHAGDIGQPTVAAPYISVWPVNTMNATNEQWVITMSTSSFGTGRHGQNYSFNPTTNGNVISKATCTVLELDTPTKVQTYDLCYEHYESCFDFMGRHKRQPTLADKTEILWGPDLPK